MGAEADRAVMYNPGRITRPDWATSMAMAREKSMTPANIRLGWRNTGLHPYNPDRLIHQAVVASRTPSPPRGLSNTSLQSVLQENSVYLRHHGRPIDTPTKTQMVSLSSSLDSVCAEKAVLEKENMELREVVKRKKRP